VNWFVWRQHRKQFLIFGVLLALFAALLIPTGISYWHTYQHALSTCTQDSSLFSCGNLANNLFTSRADGFVRIAAVLGTFGLVALVGLFLGSPLIAREYEEGTNKLAWAQSISRRKWLTTKLLWALGFALLYGVALTLLVTWWSRTINAVALNRFVQGHFETQGLMPVAYSVFFTAVGFMAGAWFRKTLVAVGITFGVFVLCMAGFAQWARPHYVAPVTVSWPMGPNNDVGKIPADAWVISRTIMDKSGKTYDSFSPQSMPAQCQALTQNTQTTDAHAIEVKRGGGDPLNDCLNSAGYHQVASYQPAYRYWNFQRIEAGIYLGMTAAAIAATYWLVIRRDA
jgi:hypothetical protein